MKKIFSIPVILFMSVIFITDINAVCDNNELNDWAEEVSILFMQQYANEEYTDEDGTVIPAYEPEFSYLLFLNPSRDQLKVFVKDNLSGKRIEVKYDDEFGDYVIGSYVHFKTKVYTIEIYADDKAEVCPGEKLRTITYKVPSYNMYSQTTYCAENIDEDICYGYTNTDISDEEFDKKVEEYEKEKNYTFLDKVLDVILDYWYVVVIPILVVSAVYIIKIQQFKKKEKREEEEVDEEDEK